MSEEMIWNVFCGRRLDVSLVSDLSDAGWYSDLVPPESMYHMNQQSLIRIGGMTGGIHPCFYVLVGNPSRSEKSHGNPPVARCRGKLEEIGDDGTSFMRLRILRVTEWLSVEEE